MSTGLTWPSAMTTMVSMSKPDPKDNDNKAPIAGSNKGADNKATNDGKPVDPNRTKED